MSHANDVRTGQREDPGVQKRTGALITYVCRALGHAVSNGAKTDQLTIHAGEWAYCAADAFRDGHDWQRTGGLEISELGRRAHETETART